MQTFSSILASEKIKDSRSRINDNFSSLQSSFSGTSFPTLNLSIGMTCYRTDLKKTYRLIQMNPDVWNEIEDLNHSPASLDYVNEKLNSYALLSGATFTGKVVAPTFEGVLSGNSATTSKLKTPIAIKLSDGATSDPYTFDGSGNLTIGVKNVNGSYVTGTSPANISGTASKLGRNGNQAIPMTFNWSGQAGQPTWLWGGENGSDMFVYNPSNFNVSHAAKAAALDSWTGLSSSFSGCIFPYRSCIVTGSNGFDSSGGTGNLSRDYLRFRDGIPAGTYTLQQILQELVNRSRYIDIYREYYNCNCDCNCDACGGD